MPDAVPEVSLQQLYASHVGKVSDKWSGYIAQYGRLFHEHRQSALRLLEIGIQNGGSLDIWAQYFPHAQRIVGCDIDPACAALVYDDHRISVVVGNANSDETQARIIAQSDAFDLVIDDGSHHTGDIVQAFVRYFPCLSNEGLFVVEDLHCSYWQEFEGGLFDPYSSMAFFKRLADVVNHEHWGVEKSRAELLSTFSRRYGLAIDEATLQHVHSIEFMNSMCAIRKRRPELNELGDRVVAGTVEQVAGGHLPRHQTRALRNSQVHNKWSMRDSAPEEQASPQWTELAERDALIGRLRVEATAKAADTARWMGMMDDRRLQGAAEKEQTTALAKTVAARDEQIAALGTTLRQKDVATQQLQLALEEHAARTAQLRQTTASQEQHVVELTRTLTDAKIELGQLAMDKTERDGRISRLARDVEVQNQAIAGRDQHIAAMAQSVAERDNRIGGLQTTLAQRDAAISASAEQRMAVEDQCRQANASLREKGAELAIALRALRRQDQYLDSLHRSVAGRDNEIDRLHRTASERDSAIGLLHRVVESRDQQLQTSQRGREAANAQVLEAVEHMAARERQVEHLLLESSGRLRQIDELRLKLAARDQELLAAQSAFASAEAASWGNRLRALIQGTRRKRGDK